MSSPLSVVPPTSGGPLMLIGGAEDKVGRTKVLARFVQLAGGSSARIVVCASASSIPEQVTGLYDSVFRSLGAAEVIPVSPPTRQAATREAATLIGDATAVFLTGGNQMTLAQILTGTPVGEAIVAASAEGAVVAGTSAGASVLSEHMMAFGTAGATPKNRMGHMARGLGLLPGLVIDQHFEQRNRYGRLVGLVAQSPSLLGVGVDEDTAAVITGGRLLEVVGKGSVFIVDARDAVTTATVASRSQPLLVSGAALHILPATNRFDLQTRALVATPHGTHPGEAVDVAATMHETREVARRRSPRPSKDQPSA